MKIIGNSFIRTKSLIEWQKNMLTDRKEYRGVILK